MVVIVLFMLLKLLAMRKIINSANYVDNYAYFDDLSAPGVMLVGEVFTKPSQTIPGQSMPLQDLLERYVRGQDVKVFSGQFGVDEDLPDGIENMDPFERAEYAQDLANAVANKRAAMAARRASKASSSSDILSES